MMDHSLRSISYIADIGDLLVIMARRRMLPNEGEDVQVIGATPKMICHVFESEEVKGGKQELIERNMSKTLFFSSSGPVHRAVDRPSLPGGLHGVPQGKRHRGPLLRQGDGLPGQSLQDFWKNKSNKTICLLFQEVLNSQEIFGDELAMFAKKELQKEVSRGEQEESVLPRRSPGDGEGRGSGSDGNRPRALGASPERAEQSRAAAAVELFN